MSVATWRAVSHRVVTSAAIAGLIILAIGFTKAPSLAAADDAEPKQVIWKTDQLDSTFFAEGATAGDLDADGQADVVSGPYWFAGPDFKSRFTIYPPKAFDPHGYSDNFFSYVDDINGDGAADVLVIGFPGAAAHWYENPGVENIRGEDAVWKKHLALDMVDNESPTYAEILGDGKKAIVCSRDGFFGFARPNVDNPTAPWTFTPISDKSAGGRFTHGLGVGDVDGDGRIDILEKSGWWKQPQSLQGNPIWEKQPFAFSGPGGAQMLVTDVDGDGLPDVITSLEAHGYGILWYRQMRMGERIGFEPHVIVGKQPADSPYEVVFTQPHAMTLADINGDGLPDLVTGKRWWAHGPKGDAEPNAPAVVYWFELRRRADGEPGPPAVFIPHLVHDDSGVGTDVQTHDLTGNGRPDIIVGNKRGTFVHRQSEQPIAASDAKRSQTVASWDAAKPTKMPRGGPEFGGLTPTQARDAMTVPPGFSVDLVAAEPRIHQPVAFTFDTSGRIWVAEAHTYPIRATEGAGADRIVILEDTDGDGNFDNRKVFVEGLNLVSGLEVGLGGVWVGAAPYLLFIPDRDGDDVPDGPAVKLLDGWGYQDTHETLNAFNWGPDGWLYGCQGVFTHSKIGKPGSSDDARTEFNAGVWRYHPTRHEFEVFAHGTSNPWGVDFDDHGQALITACVISHAFHMVQGGRYTRQAGRHFDPYTFDDIKTIADHVHYAGNIGDHAWWGRNEPVEDDATSLAGGGHAHCGAMIYLGDNWPKSYRNTLMMANIHGNRINLDHPRRDGSSFILSHGRDVIFANDPWFRGINLRYGPDGSVYLIDWYDPNACHRSSPDIWDRTNGRLFRVRYGDIKPARVDLAAEGDGELVELHEHENDWYVRAARRVLQSRYAAAEATPDGNGDVGLSVDPAALRSLLWKRAIDTARTTDRRLRYLWTCHVIKPLGDDEVVQLLSEVDPNLRAWALQLSTDRPTGQQRIVGVGGMTLAPEVVAAVGRLTHTEKSPRVRLYLASLLQRVSIAQRWELAEGMVRDADNAIDKMIPLMVWYGISPLVADDPGRAIELADASQIPLIRQFIYRRAGMDPKLLSPLVAKLAAGVVPPLAKEMVAELRRGAEHWGRIDPPPRWSEVVAQWAAAEDAEVRQSIRFLSITFGDASVFPVLRQTAADAGQPLAARRESLSALAQGRDPELLSLALRLLADPAIRADAIPLLARFDSEAVADQLIGGYSSWSGDNRRAALDVLISRPPLAHRLLDAISDKQIAGTDLTALHVSRIGQLGDEELIERLGKTWGTVRPTSDQIRGQIEKLASTLNSGAIAQADRYHGREIYSKSCGQCHKLFGEGGKLGPDLTGADRGNLRYWLENILDPNAVVGKDYQTLTALTDDGRVITGLLREETDVAIVLEDAEKRVTLPRSEIESIAPTSKSLMPEGLLQQLTPAQIASLVAYLQSPGQVPLPGQIPPIDKQTAKVPGAIEGELIDVLEITGGRTSVQPMGNFKADAWSGNSHLWWTDGKPGDHLTVGFPATESGPYEVMVVMSKAVDYGVVSARINDSEPTAPIDLYNKPDVITTGPVSLGKHRLAAGTNRLQLTLAPANPAAVPRNMVGIDYLFLVPVSPAL